MSLNPIDCIDEISTKFRGSQGELLSLTFRLWVPAHNSTLGATTPSSALLPVCSVETMLPSLQSTCGTNPGPVWTTEGL